MKRQITLILSLFIFIHSNLAQDSIKAIDPETPIKVVYRQAPTKIEYKDFFSTSFGCISLDTADSIAVHLNKLIPNSTVKIYQYEKEVFAVELFQLCDKVSIDKYKNLVLSKQKEIEAKFNCEIIGI